ncbi:phasin family protein [Tepidicaulis sp. LMO-SS28]|uniref:phasin family protein n=1 Tax=Tepidicaulis sp. LMO-SS28 TaxID=3447455 RepID=UPI003EDF488C
MPKPKTPVDRASELARRIWLAGIGAYGQAFDEAQEQMSRVNVETGKVFDDLVDRGEKLEEKLAPMRERVTERMTKTSDQTLASLEERLQRMRGMFGLSGEGSAELERKVDDLAKKVDVLDAKLDALIGKKPAAKKKTAAKKAAPKTTGKKTAGKKTAGKKTASKKR